MNTKEFLNYPFPIFLNLQRPSQQQIQHELHKWGKGLTESLAGRFETLYLGHWSYVEMQGAFGWDIEQYIYFGGYPGSASLEVIRDRHL